MKVRDVCTRIVHRCGPDTNLAEIGRIMWEFDCGSVPVVDRLGRVTGMITDRDLGVAVATRNRLPSELLARDVVVGPVHACAPDDDIRAALNTMWTHKVRRLPVVNSGGELEGILSINDAILKAKGSKFDGVADLSYEDVVMTLKAISAHRRMPSPAVA